ncbi:MAG: hypothetical protein ABIY55_07990 [Kofleriaceae bacterium]
MDTQERARLGLAIPIAWLGLSTGLFLYFFSLDLTDDYAGWIIAIVIAQIPPYLALVTARAGRPLGTGRAIALALPAALVGAFGPFFVLSVIGLTIWRAAPFEFRPYLLGLGAGVIALVVGFVLYVRRLRRNAYPRAARHVLWRVVFDGALGVIAVATRWSDAARDPGIWLAVLAPILWTVPLWWLLREPRAIPEARVRSAP